MHRTLDRWNLLDSEAAARSILPCCGSKEWAQRMVRQRPFDDDRALLEASATIWNGLSEADWQEAFDSHPRIGEKHAQVSATNTSLQWSAEEQRDAISPDEKLKSSLIEANQRYEERFGRIFIVCATGKSTGEILSILEARLHNNSTTELKQAAEEQRKITELRLRRWLETD